MMKKKYIAWILIVSILFLGRGADAMAKTSLRKPLGVLANGVDGQVVLSWESVQGADGYEVFEKTEEENVFLKLRATKQCKLVFKNKKRGSVYQYHHYLPRKIRHSYVLPVYYTHAQTLVSHSQ